MKNTIHIFLLALFVFGCKQKNESELTKKSLQGNWAKVKIVESEFYNIRPFSYTPFGLGFDNDSIDFFRGFLKYERDSITHKTNINFRGNHTKYKLKGDSLFIKNPFLNKWDFKWQINIVKKDTLVLKKNDSIVYKLIKQKYDSDNLTEFDQIIFSRSGCYGRCPIIDISLDKSGNVLFQGEGYVNPLGFYKSIVNKKSTDFIFNKFKNADVIDLSNDYSDGPTDGESITTTFIKKGKIIKTIYDYRKSAPRELLWAYVPIENLYNRIKLDSLPIDEPFYPKLQYYTFERDTSILSLQKSESFFLWTEINKSKIVNNDFKAKYTVGFRGNYTYWGKDPDKKRKHKYEIDKIESDGRYFKFYFKGQNPITYDLAYNFLEQNFKDSDFKAIQQYEE